jgi:hypothetical protein
MSCITCLLWILSSSTRYGTAHGTRHTAAWRIVALLSLTLANLLVSVGLSVPQAAQSMEPELLIPLGTGIGPGGVPQPPRRLLLAGDPRQLGPRWVSPLHTALHCTLHTAHCTAHCTLLPQCTVHATLLPQCTVLTVVHSRASSDQLLRNSGTPLPLNGLPDTMSVRPSVSVCQRELPCV